MHTMFKLSLLSGAVLLGACTTMPEGPSVMALPGTGKTFDQFRIDDMDCRQYSLAQVGGTNANQAGTNAGLKSAAVGTAVGALAGAAMGGHQGAGNGAAAGLLIGSMAGAGAADSTAYGNQRRYDNAYIQCMYAKGQRVPVPSGFATRPPQEQERSVPPPPPSGPVPPPPPGYR